MTGPDLNGAFAKIERTLGSLEMLMVGQYAAGYGMSGDKIRQEFWHIEAEEALTLLRAIKKAVDVEKLGEALDLQQRTGVSIIEYVAFKKKHGEDYKATILKTAKLLREIAGGGDE